jgi:hypothetical protein
MKMRLTKIVCSTRLRRVQFGVPPNCHGVPATVGCQRIISKLLWQSVSGVTPETTRGTRVLHNNFSLRLCVSAATE